ncbi:restriction endonuclease subunit S [Aliarcobacter butzleri]
MSNLPKGWNVAVLQDLKGENKNSFIDGDWIEAPYIAENGVRLIQTGNIGIGRFINKNKKYISEESFTELNCKEVKENDILICRLAEPVGRSCIVPSIEKSLTAVDITIFRPDNKRVNSKFINYFLNYEPQLAKANNLASGTTRKRISRSNLGKMEIPLPPLEEQTKIADILSTVDKKIASVEENINATEELKKGLMQKLLTEGISHTEFKDSELGRIPESWEIKSLSKVCNKVVDKNKDLLYLNVLTNSANLGIISQNEYFDREIVTEKNLVNYFVVNKFDYIYNPRISINAPCGPINQCKKYENGIVSPLYTVFRIEKDSINNDYLEFYFLSNHWNKYIKDNSNKGARHDRMSISDKLFFSMPIFIPPLEEQKQIAEILSTVDKKIENLKEKKLFFEELKKGLMQKLLTGEVRV